MWSADLSDGFGPEDKLNMCGSNLVFIDLDSDGDWFTYTNGAWSTGKIKLINSCTTGANLFPRSQGYIVGLAHAIICFV